MSNRFVVLFFTIYQLSLVNSVLANSQDYNASQQAQFDFLIEAEAGFFDDQALYASFGLELQPYTVSKLIFTPVIFKDNWYFYIEFAPLYHSIQHRESENIVYGIDKSGHPINGLNHYFDWYKNLGTQTYYLGNGSVREIVFNYQLSLDSGLKMGRLKNQIGLKDHDMIWGDSGKFSPLSYWLSRDLLSGISYWYQTRTWKASISGLSGNNSAKGYATYLDGIENPNTKANNTMAASLDFEFYFGQILSSANFSKVIFSVIRNDAGSTWVDELQDGKRNNSYYATGFKTDFPLINDANLFIYGQYTGYLSGLRHTSDQNNGHPRFRDILQSGYFLGALLRWHDFDIAYTREIFDRFDYNVYEKYNFSNEKKLTNSKLTANLINMRYMISNNIFMTTGLHIIGNPFKWVSDITDTFPTYRSKLTFEIYY